MSGTITRPLSLLGIWRRRFWVLRSLAPVARGWALKRYLESSAARAARLERATLGETGRLVFVCHGNIMRSAFAARVAQDFLPQCASRIAGAGTHAKAGRPAQEVALAVAESMQLPMTEHRATPLAGISLHAGDVIVCMDALNEANVLAAHPDLADQVFRVGDVAAGGVTVMLPDRELHDPYGKGEAVTRAAFEQLRETARQWAGRLLAAEPR